MNAKGKSVNNVLGDIESKLNELYDEGFSAGKDEGYADGYAKGKEEGEVSGS